MNMEIPRLEIIQRLNEENIGKDILKRKKLIKITRQSYPFTRNQTG